MDDYPSSLKQSPTGNACFFPELHLHLDTSYRAFRAGNLKLQDMAYPQMYALLDRMKIVLRESLRTLFRTKFRFQPERQAGKGALAIYCLIFGFALVYR